MKIIIIFLISSILLIISCSNKNKKNTNIIDYIQVDSPKSFIPLDIYLNISSLEQVKNLKYFIVNKNIAEIKFDYMNNDYTYRISKNFDELINLFSNYNNTDKNFIEDEYKINIEYNITSSKEIFTLWKIKDTYYTLSTMSENDKYLIDLSKLYIKSINNKN